MRIFQRSERKLKIDLGERQFTLYPGDFLWLTHEAHADIDNRQRVKAEVTHKYLWDGKALRRAST